MSVPSLSRRSMLGALAAAPLAATTTARLQDELTDRPKAAIGKTEHTQFAINIEMWFGGMPFVERIHAAADLGFSFVEFWPWRGKDLDAVKAACTERGVSVAQCTAWGFSPGMNNPVNHGKVEAEIRASCEAAKRIGAPMMTVVAGNDQDGMSQAEMHDHVITALKRVAPIAEDNDVMLIVEPMNIRVDHPGHCLYGSPDAVRICREVGSSHVKINWDLYHMQISEGDLCGRLREGYDQVGYIQLADHPGRREPGTGEINYARVLKELWDLGYRKPVGVECYPSASAEESARRLVTSTAW